MLSDEIMLKENELHILYVSGYIAAFACTFSHDFARQVYRLNRIQLHVVHSLQNRLFCDKH